MRWGLFKLYYCFCFVKNLLRFIFFELILLPISMIIIIDRYQYERLRARISLSSLSLSIFLPLSPLKYNTHQSYSIAVFLTLSLRLSVYVTHHPASVIRLLNFYTKIFLIVLFPLIS